MLDAVLAGVASRLYTLISGDGDGGKFDVRGIDDSIIFEIHYRFENIFKKTWKCFSHCFFRHGS